MADELIRLDTTIIGIDSLINKASTAEEAKALFTVKDVIYSQQKYFTDVHPVKHGWWISTSEKMPPELQDVIVSDGNFIATGYFMNLMEMWHIYGNSIPQHKEAYTYWQPLPEPPERSNK